MVKATRPCAVLALGLIGLFGLIGNAHGAPQVRVEPDRQRLSLDERLRVRITVQGEQVLTVGSPESEDFAVVGHNTSSRFQMVPGQPTVQATDIDLVLRPRRAGRLLVGPIPIRTASGVTHTDPFSVLVEDSPRAPRPAGRTDRSGGVPPPSVPDKPGERPPAPAPGSEAMTSGPVPDAPRGQPFIVGFLSNDRPVTGEPFIVDFVLHAPSMQLGMEIVDVDDPVFEGFWFQDITRERLPHRGTRLGSVRHQGELHDLHLLRSYSVVPLRDGLDRVPPFGALARIRGFLQNEGELQMRSLPIPLDVSPPPTPPSGASGPTSNVGRLQLSAALSSATARVGQPVRLTITASGIGLMSRMLLPNLPDIDGIIPGEARDRVQPDNGLWPGGEASREWTLRGDSPGDLEIPALLLQYWDPWRGAWQVAETPPLRLTFEPGEEDEPLPLEAPASARWQDHLPSGPARGNASVPPQSRPWFLPVVATPLLLLGAAAARPRVVRWIATRRRKAAPGPREVLRQLDTNAPPAVALRAIASALQHALSDRLGADAKGRTFDAMRRLAGRDADALAMIDLLDEVERARFGHPTAAGAADFRERAMALLPERVGEVP